MTPDHVAVSPEERGDQRRFAFYRRVVGPTMYWALLVFSFFSALMTIGFLIAGIYEGGRALLIFTTMLPVPTGFGTSEDAAMALALKAIELILLAPLAHLFIQALARFIREIGEDRNWAASYRGIVVVKSLTTTLLISIVAADFVRKVLEGGSLDISNTLLEGAVFLLLVGYLLVIERGERTRSSEPSAADNPAGR